MSECKICGTGCQWVFCGDCEKLIGNGIDEYDRTIADLTAKLKLAVEALEHYANDSNWQPIVKGRITTDIYAGDGCGYDIARQSLAKIGEQR